MNFSLLIFAFLSTINYCVSENATFSVVPEPRGASGTVQFFEFTYCRGEYYYVQPGNGECVNLPVSIYDWNLSILTNGYCVKVFEGNYCGGKWQIYNENVCKSTKLYGLDTVRSLRRWSCY